MNYIDGNENCKTNSDNSQEQTNEQYYVNMMQEAGSTDKCCTNTHTAF